MGSASRHGAPGFIVHGINRAPSITSTINPSIVDGETGDNIGIAELDSHFARHLSPTSVAAGIGITQVYWEWRRTAHNTLAI